MKISRVIARDPKVQQAYHEHLARLDSQYGGNMPCPLCSAAERQVVEETDEMLVVVNDFPYNIYDGRSVLRHMMIVPKRHEPLFAGFSDKEKTEYWGLVVKYHEAGFANMTRSAVDAYRSIPDHLHTHLFYYADDQV